MLGLRQAYIHNRLVFSEIRTVGVWRMSRLTRRVRLTVFALRKELMSITTEQRKDIQGYLRGYTTGRKLLRLERYEQEYFGDGNKDDNMPCETPLARAKMFDVRHFVLSLPNGDEKLFLYFHYIKGESVVRCAELLGISERAAFRMKNRALALAYSARKGK